MAFIDPLRKVRCPYCSAVFYPGECAIISRTTGAILEPAPQGDARLTARFWVKSLVGAKYVQKFASRQCPNCGKALPYNIELVDNIMIAVVGDTFSGKSHYIAALVHELKEERI